MNTGTNLNIYQLKVEEFTPRICGSEFASLAGNVWENVALDFFAIESRNAYFMRFTEMRGEQRAHIIATAKFESFDDMKEVFNFLKSMKLIYFTEEQMEVLFSAFCDGQIEFPAPYKEVKPYQKAFFKFCADEKVKTCYQLPEYK